MGPRPFTGQDPAVRALGQTLRETSNQLAEQDAEYQNQLALEKQQRDRRSQAIERLRNQLRGARFLLDQTFGKEKASEYFPKRADLTRLVPRYLLPLARSISRLLRGSGVVWPPLDGENHVPKPLDLATSLDATAAELEASRLWGRSAKAAISCAGVKTRTTRPRSKP